MDYNLIARDLLRSTDGLNNIEVDDFCLAIGVDFEVIDSDGSPVWKPMRSRT
nr:MAG TPA: hypothetical protein [Caudoviricetes sp.]